MTPQIYVGVPVHRDGGHLQETLLSIREQTFEDYRVVMSVDGPDDPSIVTCEKFVGDPRFELVVQPEHLGWARNLNWLANNCDSPFFCYWPQDDIASTQYLEELRKELLARPDATVAYTDVQWFGARFDREGTPSIEGDTLPRVMQCIEAIRFEPLRGLMRMPMTPSSEEVISVTQDESCQEEFVLLARLAASGALLRVDRAMYFKRFHSGNAFSRWRSFPAWRRRRAWISMGVGMFKLARELAEEGEEARILTHVIDRLAIVRHGRAHFYLPPQSTEELRHFVHDFVSFGRIALDEHPIAHLLQGSFDRPISMGVLDGLIFEARFQRDRDGVGDALRSKTSVEISPGLAPNNSLLGFGWSQAEPWGVWNDGDEAHVLIPALGENWRATLRGRRFPERPGRLGWAVDDGDFSYATFDSPDATLVVSGPKSEGGCVVRLCFPDAASPLSIGVSNDSRHLAFGIEEILLEVA